MSLNNIERSLGKIEGQLDSLIKDMKILRENTNKNIENLEERVQRVERKQYGIILIATLCWTAGLMLVKKFF